MDVAAQTANKVGDTLIADGQVKGGKLIANATIPPGLFVLANHRITSRIFTVKVNDLQPVVETAPPLTKNAGDSRVSAMTATMKSKPLFSTRAPYLFSGLTGASALGLVAGDSGWTFPFGGS